MINWSSLLQSLAGMRNSSSETQWWRSTLMKPNKTKPQPFNITLFSLYPRPFMKYIKLRQFKKIAPIKKYSNLWHLEIMCSYRVSIDFIVSKSWKSWAYKFYRILTCLKKHIGLLWERMSGWISYCQLFRIKTLIIWYLLNVLPKSFMIFSTRPEYSSSRLWSPRSCKYLTKTISSFVILTLWTTGPTL